MMADLFVSHLFPIKAKVKKGPKERRRKKIGLNVFLRYRHRIQNHADIQLTESVTRIVLTRIIGAFIFCYSSNYLDS